MGLHAVEYIGASQGSLGNWGERPKGSAPPEKVTPVSSLPTPDRFPFSATLSERVSAVLCLSLGKCELEIPIADVPCSCLESHGVDIGRRE